MGIVIYAPYRGRGYAVTALKLLLDYAFRELGVEDGFPLMMPLTCTRFSVMMKPWNTGLLEEDWIT